MRLLRCLRSPALPHRQEWHNLSSYAATRSDKESWNRLSAADTIVTNTQNVHPLPSIDWSFWEKNIAHSTLVASLKKFYDKQMSNLETVKKEDHELTVKSCKDGWHYYEAAMDECQKAVEASENLVANGARGLWLSYHNPPLPQVDDAEWLDSDPHFQAVVERQFLYNPTANVVEESLPKWQQTLKECWKFKMDSFNARSDTPVLYKYMGQLPSWEFYDIHRQAFLEHMMYYMVRTGGNYRLFPECPPWKWLSDIEELRFRFLAVAQRRKRIKQIDENARDLALDLQPLDQSHGGEEYTLKLLKQEYATYDYLVGHLMSNFIFLSHPYIPIQSFSAFYRTKAGPQGKFLSIGDDVSSLFFLPTDPPALCRPLASFFTLLDHLSLKGKRFNPTYATALGFHAELLESRGEHWFKTPGESMADAFLRRLDVDDPAREIYIAYVDEMRARFANATIISETDVINRLAKIQNTYRDELTLFRTFVSAFSTELSGTGDAGRLDELITEKRLEERLVQGDIVIEDEFGVSASTDAVLEDLVLYSDQKKDLVELSKNEKSLGLSKKPEPHEVPDPLFGSRADMKHLHPHFSKIVD